MTGLGAQTTKAARPGEMAATLMRQLAGSIPGLLKNSVRRGFDRVRFPSVNY